MTPGLAAQALSPGKPATRRTIEVDDAVVAYAEVGSGERVVVLVHGALTTLDDMLLALGEHLPGRRIIALDRPGFGGSTRRTTVEAGVLRQARRLNQALEALNTGPAVLVGHSFGAPVALAMAMQAPANALGVVSLAPLVTPEPRLEHLLFGPRGVPMVGAWISRLSHAGLDRAMLPLLWRVMFLPQAMPATVAAAFPFALAGAPEATARVGEDSLAAGPDLLAVLACAPRFRAPLHVLGGACDMVVNSLAHGLSLAAVAPRGRFSLLPGVGHMLHHVAPDVVVEAIDDIFLTAG